MASTDNSCILSGCERVQRSRGLCHAHYERWRKTGVTGAAEVSDRQRGRCTVEGCERLHSSLGYCKPHYDRQRRANNSIKRPKMTGCSVPDCSGKYHAKDCCRLHYSRWIKTGTTDLVKPQRRVRPPCLIEGCELPFAARGYCSGHYARLLQRGDVDAARPLGELHQPVVGYRAAHTRVRKTRGAATNHPCCHCGGVAGDWAYTNDDPNELVDDIGRYSLDLARYIPLCRSCHLRFDQGHRWGEKER